MSSRSPRGDLSPRYASRSRSYKRARSRSRRSRSRSYNRRRRSRSRSNGYGYEKRGRQERAGGDPPKIFIGNIDHYTDEIDLENVFKKYGDLEDVYVPRDQKNRSNRGYAFVSFMDMRDAEDACNEDGKELQGRRIGVNIAKRRPGGPGSIKTYVPSRDGEGGSMRAWLGTRRRSRSYERRRSRTRSRQRRSSSRRRYR